MAGKTQWEGHTRVPRTWLLDDGSTLDEPLLERTTGGRRVRSTEDKTFTGNKYDAANLAFTAVLRKAKARGRIVICEAHTADMLKRRLGSMSFPADPPMLHLTNDYYAHHAASGGRLESDKTRFWTTWEHPTLPIHFVSVNGIETSHYTADVLHTLWHLPFFPGLGLNPDEQLCAAPATGEVANSLNSNNVPNALFSRVSAYWPEVELWQHFPANTTSSRVIEGRREALRLMLIQSMKVGRLESLEVPDLWTAVSKFPVNQSGEPTWDGFPPAVDLRKTGSNIDDDTIESFKAYVTGADAAAKASALYKQLRNELTHAGIVLGEVKDDAFLHMLTNTTRPLTTTITGARNVAENKTPQSSYSGRRRVLTLSEQHSVVVDLVTGFVSVGCPHGDEPESVPTMVTEAWDEAHTIASLSGKHEAFIEFATEYLRVKAENRVLTEALARRK